VRLPDSEKRYEAGWNLIIFISFYLYLWLRINPVLYYQSQEPVFFFDTLFFKGFLHHPGGLVEYLSAFLSQFYYYPWAGAFIITLVTGLICLNTFGLIRSIRREQPVLILHLIPAILLLILHSQYDHPLAMSVGLLVALCFVNLFVRIVPQHLIVRFISYLVLVVLLHYLVGGPVLLFIGLAGLYEMLANGHRWLLGLAFWLTGTIIPFLTANYLYMVNTKISFFHLLALKPDYQPSITPYLLYLYFPLVVLWIGLSVALQDKSFFQKLKHLNPFLIIKNLIKRKVVIVVSVLVYMILAVTAAIFSFNKQVKTILTVDNYARHEKWEKILGITKNLNFDHVLVTAHTNRALYHLGRLPYDMFAFSQKWPEDGLLLNKEFGAISPLSRSDIFFDLGHINEAQHWAYEALTLRGETPWILQRLALVSLLKGQKAMAQKCLLRLSKTLFFRKWARQYQPYLENDTLISQDKRFQDLRSRMIDSDFIVHTAQAHLDLKSILARNGRNKMAFEYLMAYYLMQGELGKFMTNITRLPELGYSQIPRLYAEAIILYVSQTGCHKIELPGYLLSADTINRYKQFYEILSRHVGNKLAALSELEKKHRETYWFYLVYYKPSIPEGNNEESF